MDVGVRCLPILSLITFFIGLILALQAAYGTHSYSHDEPVDGKDVKAVVAALDRNVQSGLSAVMGGPDDYFSTRIAVASAVPYQHRVFDRGTLGDQP